MTKVFANVRPESKYYEGQVQDKPFPVRFEPDIAGYHWQGGIGGQYRTDDLHFFMEAEFRGEVQLKPFLVVNHSELQSLDVTCNSILKGVGKEWGSGYWEKVIKKLEALLRKARKQYKAELAKEEEERENERWGY
ncbi:hypothetical protein J7438_06945 [Thalassotalea sp. G20_0]|uniref:hypothetical protein n=1 Tax=Thalassotalea sp. G20_0 TaxID=2821093 RepID=UPI001ADA3551|nr:hypothetical protein [Thalassotalea sp. G20_0]MBO9493821.1 hypothetical protein [Thalassotalea sp. G20_0]